VLQKKKKKKDFGTTFSGCCYAFSKDGNDEIIDITKWYKFISSIKKYQREN
jgi:hypothetical protein